MHSVRLVKRAELTLTLTLHKPAMPLQVAVAAVPPGISLATAEAVLFIGKAVRILRQPPGARCADPQPGADSCKPQPGALSLPAVAGPPRAPHAPGGESSVGCAAEAMSTRISSSAFPSEAAAARGAAAGGPRQRWAAELQRLAAAPAFSALDFERVVEGIRSQAWAQWSLAKNLCHTLAKHLTPAATAPQADDLRAFCLQHALLSSILDSGYITM